MPGANLGRICDESGGSSYGPVVRSMVVSLMNNAQAYMPRDHHEIIMHISPAPCNVYDLKIIRNKLLALVVANVFVDECHSHGTDIYHTCSICPECIVVSVETSKKLDSALSQLIRCVNRSVSTVWVHHYGLCNLKRGRKRSRQDAINIIHATTNCERWPVPYLREQ